VNLEWQANMAIGNQTKTGAVSFAFCKLLAKIIANVLAWLIWRPLGAYLTVMLIGDFRGLVSRMVRNGAAPIGLSIVGVLIGIIAVVVTQVAAYCAFTALWSSLLLVGLGFMCVSYIGYGVQGHWAVQLLVNDKCRIASSSAQVSYGIFSMLVLSIRCQVYGQLMF
jgi:hypothetical protein